MLSKQQLWSLAIFSLLFSSLAMLAYYATVKIMTRGTGAVRIRILPSILISFVLTFVLNLILWSAIQGSAART